METSKKCKVVMQEVEQKTIGGSVKFFHNFNITMDNQASCVVVSWVVV